MKQFCTVNGTLSCSAWRVTSLISAQQGFPLITAKHIRRLTPCRDITGITVAGNIYCRDGCFDSAQRFERTPSGGRRRLHLTKINLTKNYFEKASRLLAAFK